LDTVSVRGGVFRVLPCKAYHVSFSLLLHRASDADLAVYSFRSQIPHKNCVEGRRYRIEATGVTERVMVETMTTKIHKCSIQYDVFDVDVVRCSMFDEIRNNQRRVFRSKIRSEDVMCVTKQNRSTTQSIRYLYQKPEGQSRVS
jgi:hypothetical protein